jgi:hypothetical protein
MDANERDTAALTERVAEWALGVRDRTKNWLWFLEFAILAIVFAARARLGIYWIVSGLIAAVFLFEWLTRKKAQKEWQRYEFARQHFRALLECRKTVESMTKEERGEVKTEVVTFLLDTFLPGGLEHPVFWDDVEDGVMFPAMKRMKLESMGFSSRRDEFPSHKCAEYAWDRYGEIDPEREWIGKLRVRGGYVESSEKLREKLNRHKAPYGTKH